MVELETHLQYPLRCTLLALKFVMSYGPADCRVACWRGLAVTKPARRRTVEEKVCMFVVQWWVLKMLYVSVGIGIR